MINLYILKIHHFLAYNLLSYYHITEEALRCVNCPVPVLLIDKDLKSRSQNIKEKDLFFSYLSIVFYHSTSLTYSTPSCYDVDH
jgi:hypothetical protein